MSKTIYVNGRFLTQEITGIQRFSYEICKALISKGVGMVILAPKKIRPEYILKCKIVQFGFFSDILWEQIDLPLFLMRQNNPFLFNPGSPGPIFYSNRIVTIHDLSFFIHPEWFSKLYQLYYRFVTPMTARRSKSVVTVSEFSKEEIIRLIGLPEGKITVINNAVSSSVQKGPSVNTTSQDPYIFSVGSLDPRKNIARLVRAYEMAGIGNEIKLILAGRSDPIFNMELSQEIVAYSKGYLPDDEISSFYENATLFVYPSLYEGFGIPPLEAMSMGCPVVLSDIPVFREIFGDAAYYVNPLDSGSIRDGISLVLSDEPLRRELMGRGYERAKMYDWESSADKLASLIHSIS
ncbi:MAG: glycosyltransferase family 1 protein [Bacteroidota bacterium]